MPDIKSIVSTRPVDIAYTRGAEDAAKKIKEQLDQNDAQIRAGKQTASASVDAAMSVLNAEPRRAPAQLGGWVSVESLASLTLMIPVVTVGGELLNRLLDTREHNWSQDRLTLWVAFLVALALCVLNWPTLMETRGYLARGLISLVFLVLNTLILCGAALGIAEVIGQDNRDNTSGNQIGTPAVTAAATPTPTPDFTVGPIATPT